MFDFLENNRNEYRANNSILNSKNLTTKSKLPDKKQPLWIFIIAVTITLTVFTTVVLVINTNLKEEIRHQIIDRDAKTIYLFTRLDHANDGKSGIFKSLKSSMSNTNGELIPALWSSDLQGIIALQIFDGKGVIKSTIPNSLIPASLSESDLQTIQQHRPIGKFHEKIWLDSLFDDSRFVLSDAPVPLLEIIIPVHENKSKELEGIMQYWIDGKSMAEEIFTLERNILIQTLIALACGDLIIFIILTWAFNRLKQVNLKLCQEIDQRLEVEQTLSLSEKKYRHIFENTLTPYYEASPNGELLEISPSIENITKYKRDELIGKRIPEIKDTSADNNILGSETIKSGSIFNGEIYLQDKDGHQIEAIIRGKYLKEEQKVIGSLLDITDRKKAEREILQLRNQLRDIFNAIPSMIVSVDDNSNIVSWNKSAEESTGLSLNEVKGKPFVEALPRYAGQRERIMTVIKKSSIENDTFFHVYEDGTAHFDNISISPLLHGSKGGAVIRIDDITEKVRAEQLSIHAEKMMSVGSLAAGLAHELNNPLSAILQGTQNVIRRFTPELQKNMEIAEKFHLDLLQLQAYLVERKIMRNLEGIHSAGIRATRIINNMLQLSRKNRAEMARVNLNRLLKNAINLVTKDFDQNSKQSFENINITTEFDQSLDYVVCAESEIEQVIINLMNNAAQAINGFNAESDNKIVVRTQEEGSMVRIEVEDNGPGIDESAQRRLFEPFYTTKPTGEGTGLGLSISYMIITNNHKGNIEVHSQLGQGTKFIIRLPLNH